MDTSLQVSQNLSLYPRLIQSMEILQMNAQELSEYINSLLQENPLLEFDESEDDSDIKKRAQLYIDDLWIPHKVGSLNNNEGVRFIDVIPHEDFPTLAEYLLFQAESMNLDADTFCVVRSVIVSLNSNGYLDDSVAYLKQEFGYSESRLMNAIDIVQKFDPAGVAARNLSECLCIQLRRRNETGLPLILAESFLPDIAKNRYHSIAKKNNCTQEEVLEAVDIIRSLQPRPGALFTKQDSLKFIWPDATVEFNSNQVEITMHNFFSKPLQLNPYYQKILKETEDEEVRRYLSQKENQAKYIVQGLDRRSNTIQSCISAIVELQEEFFSQGDGNLKPMTLAEVAECVGVHESTVSRAVRDKYIQFKGKVIPLSYFFSRAMSKKTAEAVCHDRVKQSLKELISKEDKRRPLSDQQICEKMKMQKIDVSRRTITKYRLELGIGSSASRRTMK